jgi:DNA-binding transcriptional regulator YhcF (GntR family)
VIRIDLSDRTPPYQQIRAAVLGALATGELLPGDRLPTVRQLAGDLGVAPGTVQRAYAELEEDGALESRGRRGTFARTSARGSASDSSSLAAAAQDFVAEVDRLGVGPAEAIAAIAALLARRPAS